MINKSWQHYLVFGFLLTLSLIASTRAGPADSRLTITVQVIDYAAVPERTLIQAEQGVAEIFRQVGVHTVWRNVSRSHEEEQRNPLPLQLRILILRRAIAKQHQGSLGVAFRGNYGQPGQVAYIFHQRLEELVQKGGIRELKGRILGLAIAHEIGHLLLPTHSHSSTGIMRAEWHFPSGRDFHNTTSRNLGFTPQQAKLIHKVVKRMMEHEGSKGR